MNKQTSLGIEALGSKFENPLVLASGILGVTGASLARVVKNGAGGVTMKSVTVEAIEGNPNPTMLGQDEYFLNAVGLPGPGIEASLPELSKFQELCSGVLIGSIYGRTWEEFGEAARQIREAPIDLLEIDISCPHASHLYDRPFSHDPESIEKITKLVKKNSNVPVSVKLSPNTWQIGELAKIAEAAGADAITAVNTALGMEISIEARRPVLANKSGGLSGPALKPIALKAVWDIYEAVSIPIIGTGGVTTGDDAIQMMMSGATLVGVGTAFYYRGEKTMSLIAKEMQERMGKEGISEVKELIGMAHEE
ncbi:MAG: dihydroorotate dehydrogenase [Candidatus Kerfeldbacteria bacterium]